MENVVGAQRRKRMMRKVRLIKKVQKLVRGRGSA